MTKPKKWYHGTTTVVLAKIQSGSKDVKKVYTESNISLGGAYFAREKERAEFYAIDAARLLGGNPVVLEVTPDALYPDEDWVVSAIEDAPTDGYKIKDQRLQEFFDDLFDGYVADNSLSDHYRDRYDELNDYHGITWQDSEDWISTARQEGPLRAEQIVNVEYLEAI